MITLAARGAAPGIEGANYGKHLRPFHRPVREAESCPAATDCPVPPVALELPCRGMEPSIPRRGVQPDLGTLRSVSHKQKVARALHPAAPGRTATASAGHVY